ncbi:MAG: hypothetical protein RLZZ210_1265 [Pseudomonadota bacterium]|jgi:hypothetical protein
MMQIPSNIFIAKIHGYRNTVEFWSSLNIHQLANLADKTYINYADKQALMGYVKDNVLSGASELALFSDNHLFSEHNLASFPDLVSSVMPLLKKQSDCEYVRGLCYCSH